MLALGAYDAERAREVVAQLGVLADGLRGGRGARELAACGLAPLPRRSYLWTDDAYGPYLRDLLPSIAAGARRVGRIDAAEEARWNTTLEALAADGQFYYGLVHYLVAGRRA